MHRLLYICSTILNCTDLDIATNHDVSVFFFPLRHIPMRTKPFCWEEANEQCGRWLKLVFFSFFFFFVYINNCGKVLSFSSCELKKSLKTQFRFFFSFFFYNTRRKTPKLNSFIGLDRRWWFCVLFVRIVECWISLKKKKTTTWNCKQYKSQ